jgi:hypothetical protein
MMKAIVVRPFSHLGPRMQLPTRQLHSAGVGSTFTEGGSPDQVTFSLGVSYLFDIKLW